MIGLNDVTNGSRPVCENRDDEARIFITVSFPHLVPHPEFCGHAPRVAGTSGRSERVSGAEFQTETISTRRSQTDPVEKQPTVAYSHIS